MKKAMKAKIINAVKRNRRIAAIGAITGVALFFPIKAGIPSYRNPEVIEQTMAIAKAKPGFKESQYSTEKIRRLIAHSPLSERIRRDLLNGWQKNSPPKQAGSLNYSPDQKTKKRIRQFALIADRYAKSHGLNPNTIKWLIESESSWNPKATAQNPRSIGLMQVTGTALTDLQRLEKLGKLKKFGIPHQLPKRVDLFNPRHNILIGTAYYKLCFEMLKETIPQAPANVLERLAIVAYKRGIGRVMNNI